MIYQNPIIKGFYPDPSVCEADGRYYMVCSSFQYFPGVPLFESEDLVNWVQIGNVLTRPTQVQLESVGSSGGVFAPTIRYNGGRFYMVTTNDTTHQNFYVYTDDIYGEWSDPIFIDQGGIDPSLLFDNGKVYFISNGVDDHGVGGITQCEIDIETGRKLSHSKSIWQGSGGRYLESPHMYKLDGGYYLMAAEGGTEYGHMITYARADDPWGEFKGYDKNPVLTNRNLGGYPIQGVGHGDLVRAKDGSYFIIHLGFRQIGQYDMFHHLGREVFMTPVYFDSEGNFTCGDNGTTRAEFEIKGEFGQQQLPVYNFGSIKRDLELVYLRKPVPENYALSDSEYVLKGTEITIDEPKSPTFVGIRQRDFNATLECEVCITNGEGGITLYMDENHHYDLKIRKTDRSFEAVLKLNIGDIKHEAKVIELKSSSAKLKIAMNNYVYSFGIEEGGEYHDLGTAQTKYLSSEVACGFTGVITGFFAHWGEARFSGFELKYN